MYSIPKCVIRIIVAQLDRLEVDQDRKPFKTVMSVMRIGKIECSVVARFSQKSSRGIKPCRTFPYANSLLYPWQHATRRCLEFKFKFPAARLHSVFAFLIST
ncbi:hypothetical protein ANTQUA_LOCUS2181 [Anthophora quadrimaculata]